VKAIKNFRIVDIDINYLEEAKERYVKKKNLVKAEALKQLIKRLKSKKEFDSKVLEKEVNLLIDENKKQLKELLKQIKETETRINTLSKYSKREINGDEAVLATLSNL